MSLVCVFTAYDFKRNRVVDLGFNLVHDITLELEVLIENASSFLSVDLEPNHPPAWVPVRLDFLRLLIQLNECLIFLNDGGRRIGVVIDAPVTDQVRQVRVLDLRPELVDLFFILAYRWIEKNLERWCLNLASNVDNFVKTWDTKRHVF